MEINYQAKIISDSLNKNKVETYEITLLCNTTESLFFTKEAKDYYDVLSGKKENKSLNAINTSFGAIPRFPKVRGSTQKMNGKTIVHAVIGKHIFSYEEPELTWELLKETKDIKGFHCKLAKTTTDTNDTFFAWYTEDITIPEGPFRFKGLLGLVLEVYNKNKTIEFSAIEITKSDEIIEPLSYLDVIKTKNKRQYLETRKNYIENPSSYNGNIRLFDASGKEITNNIKEKLKKINVFLD